MSFPNPFKVVCVGNSSVGKSSIVRCYCGIEWSEEHASTIGASMFIKKGLVEKEGVTKPVTMHIWETGGQERFFSLVPMYLRNADAVLLVFDTSDFRTDRTSTIGHSLTCLEKAWLPMVQDQIRSPVAFFTVGNKIDLLSPERMKAIQQQIDDYGLPEPLSDIRYVSAKENRGVDALFEDIVQALVHESFMEKKRTYEKKQEEKSLLSILPENTASPHKCCFRGK